MLLDARLLEAGTRLACDLCIIGSGAAGITLARAVAGTGLHVCVLESGDRGSSPGAQALAGAESVGRRYLPVAETRQRRFGGTTGWSVGAAELGPFYARAEVLCGLCAGSFEPASAWLQQRAGIPLALDPGRFRTRIFKYGAPVDFAQAYAHDLASATNVRVLLNATATDLETDASGRVVQGVRALSAPNRDFAVGARTVVLAAGGIENARLLLVSIDTRPAGLGDDHDQVGRSFMEHVFFDDVASFEPAALDPSLPLYGRRWAAAGARCARPRRQRRRCWRRPAC